MGVWLRPTRSCPALQNQEYEHPRDLAACCGSCRNVSCLFTFPNGTTSLFLVCSPRLPTREGAPELGPDGALGHTGLQSCALPVHSGHPSGRKSSWPTSVPSSPGRRGSQTAPATTAAALPWALCWSARPSAAHHSTRPSVPRSVPAPSVLRDLRPGAPTVLLMGVLQGREGRSCV